MAEPGARRGRAARGRGADPAGRREVRDGLRRQAFRGEPLLREVQGAAGHEARGARRARGEDGPRPGARPRSDRGRGHGRAWRRRRGRSRPLRSLQARPRDRGQRQGAGHELRGRHGLQLLRGVEAAAVARARRRVDARPGADRPGDAGAGEPHARRDAAQDQHRADGARREDPARLDVLDGGRPEPARVAADLDPRSRRLGRRRIDGAPVPRGPDGDRRPRASGLDRRHRRGQGRGRGEEPGRRRARPRRDGEPAGGAEAGAFSSSPRR